MAIGPGDGTTITFGTSGFTGEIVSISGPNGTRLAIDGTHLGSTNWKAFTASGLVDGGEVSLTVHYDPTITVPVTAAAETITIDPNGSGATLSFTGFVISFGHNFAIDELMELSMTLKVTGAITGI